MPSHSSAYSTHPHLVHESHHSNPSTAPSSSASSSSHHQIHVPHSLTLDYKLFETIFKNKSKVHISSFHYSSQGVRDHMEDEFISTQYAPHHAAHHSSSSHTNNPPLQYKIFGVFDGHSGIQAASFCKKELIHSITKQSMFDTNVDKAITLGFAECDEKMKKTFATNNISAGCTACVALIYDSHVTVANVGDSRCILAQQGHTLEMSEDHKPMRQDEKKRIENTGGKVLYQRVNGILAVSRAFGDFEFRKVGVIAEPELKKHEITKHSDFMIIASDGLYDVLSNEQIIHFCYNKLLETRDAQVTVKELVKLALAKDSQDNITVLMILFHEMNR